MWSRLLVLTSRAHPVYVTNSKTVKISIHWLLPTSQRLNSAQEWSESMQYSKCSPGKNLCEETCFISNRVVQFEAQRNATLSRYSDFPDNAALTTWLSMHIHCVHAIQVLKYSEEDLKKLIGLARRRAYQREKDKVWSVCQCIVTGCIHMWL